MIKLKNLIKEETKHACECGGDCCSTEQLNESAFDINLPQGMEVGKVFTGNAFAFKEETFDEDEKPTLVESNIKVLPAKKIDSRTWRQMKNDLRDQFDELVKIGQDYGVFQNAQGTAKMLKQIKRLMDKI